MDLLVFGAGFAAGTTAYLMKTNQINEENRAAETVMPVVDEKIPGTVSTTYRRPDLNLEPNYLTSLFSGNNPGTYHPGVQSRAMDYEKQIKVLNVENKFLNG